MKAYLFDIDGTLADTGHRQHHLQTHPKDWDGFFADMPLDPPIQHICSLMRELHDASFCDLVYVTGRPRRYYDATVAWLREHDLPPAPVYMRADDDRRPDHEVKLELLAEIRKDGFEPVLCFDDRSSVVQMWRANGVPCAQVAEGDF